MRLSTDEASKRIDNPWRLGARVEVWMIFVGASFVFWISGGALLPWVVLRVLWLLPATVLGFSFARWAAPHLSRDFTVRVWLRLWRAEVRSPRPGKGIAVSGAAVTPEMFGDQGPLTTRTVSLADLFTNEDPT